MAQPGLFVHEFREAVIAMVESYNRAMALAEKSEGLTWDESTYSAVLVNADISGTDFYNAVQLVLGMKTTAAGMYAALYKLMK